jgi:two-component system response regulator YesN
MNIKQLIPNKNNTFISWLASYAVILIIPIIIGSFAYFSSIRIIKEEVNKAQNASLEQLKSVIDGKLEEINKLSSALIFNQRVTQLAYMDRSLDAADFIKINEVQSDLSKFKISNEFIDDIYIYFDNNNFLLTDKYKYGDEEYDFLSKNDFGISGDELSKLVKGKQLRNYKTIATKDGTSTRVNKVVFIQSIYSSDLRSTKGALIISIDADKLLQLLQKLQWDNEGKAMIIDNRNNFIVNGKMDSFPQVLSYSSLEKEGSTFYKKVMGNNVAITNTKSEVTDWRYIYLIPSKVYLQKAQYVKNMVYIYIGICLFLGFIMSYVFARKNYRPVKKIAHLFASRLGKTTGQESNVFNFLETSLKNILDENDNNIAKLIQHKEVMRNNLFVRILKGRIKDSTSMKNLIENYEIKLKSDNYIVMIYTIEYLSDHLFRENALEDEETMSLIFFIVRNVVEELSREKHIGYMVEIDGMMICLVNLNKQTAEDMNRELLELDMMEIAEKSFEFIENKFGIGISVSISEAHSGISGIAKAYSEVLEVLEYKNLTEDKSKIAFYSTINSSNKCEVGVSYNLERERQFINSIKANDYNRAIDILDDMITSEMMNNFRSMQIMKCRMFGLINSMLNTIWEIQTEVDVKFFEDLDPVNRLLNTKSIVDLKNQVHYILGQIGEYFYNRNKTQIPQWVLEIENFVQDNYHDRDLSIGSISERFDMSVSYISRTYKKLRSVGLLDFVHKVRMEKAKELMNTDLNIKEISEKVGYLDSKAMIRAFKRYEGITPKKFRESE